MKDSIPSLLSLLLLDVPHIIGKFVLKIINMSNQYQPLPRTMPPALLNLDSQVAALVDPAHINLDALLASIHSMAKMSEPLFL